MSAKSQDKKAWYWVPSLYYTEGIPYVIVITVSVIMYKKLEISNSDIGLYTSLLYLPWVIKPLWSPFVDMISTKKRWFVTMQAVLAMAFILAGLTLSTSHFFLVSLACFWMAAFASATNDIASDGYYMLALSEKKQSFFLGVRSTFYRLASITGQGLVVVIAGTLENYYGDNQKAWSLTMILTGLLMAALSVSNYLSTPNIEERTGVSRHKTDFLEVFRSFFSKPGIGQALAFVLLYRLGESQLVKMAAPFLLDDRASGGLGLSTTAVGTIYGTLGVIALLIGGILGGIAISRDGLGRWLMPMILALNIPNALYILLSVWQPDTIIFPTMVVMVEQFGYGFGFAAYLMYLIYLSDGISKTSHYAIATGFMALGMMIPGMISGYLQEFLGYAGFFIWVVIAALPGIWIAKKLKFPSDFGKKEDEEPAEKEAVEVTE